MLTTLSHEDQCNVPFSAQSVHVDQFIFKDKAHFVIICSTCVADPLTQRNVFY